MRKIIVAAALALAVASSANAAIILYVADLSGPAEAPPNASPGTGYVRLFIDTVLHTATYDASFSGLIGNTTNAHVHCCTAVPGVATAGVATTTPSFTGFPSGVTSGTFFRTFDLTLASSWNPAYITANGGTPGSAEAAWLAGIAGGRAYFNIHSTVFGPGEIRGFLRVPEPTSVGLVALGLAGLLIRRRRRS